MSVNTNTGIGLSTADNITFNHACSGGNMASRTTTMVNYGGGSDMAISISAL